MNSLLETLKKLPGYQMHETVEGNFKGQRVKYIHVYVDGALINNPWNLETFSNVVGRGYLIELKTPIKSKIMATTKKKAPAKKASAKKKTPTTAKKLCSSVIKREGVKSNGQLKKGYRYAAGGKVVKAKAAPKKK